MGQKTVIATLLVFSLTIFNLNTKAGQASKPPQAKSKAEYDAYYEMYSEKDMGKKARLSDRFLRSFPNSEYSFSAGMIGLRANRALGRHNEIVRIGEKILTDLPQTKIKSKIGILTQMINSYQQLNNIKKTVAISDRLLRLDPKHLPTLLRRSSVLPLVLPDTPEEQTSQLKRALDITFRAKEQVNIYLNRPKPPKVSDSQWEKSRVNLLSQIHTALGAIYFYQKDFRLSVLEYQRATELVKTDGTSFYKMGNSYLYQAEAISEEITQVAQSNPSDASVGNEKLSQYKILRDNAIESFAKVIALKNYVPTEILEAAKTNIERLYLHKNNNSLVGLEALILEVGQTLNSN